MGRFFQYSGSERLLTTRMCIHVCFPPPARKSVLLTKEEILAINKEAGCPHYNTKKTTEFCLPARYVQERLLLLTVKFSAKLKIFCYLQLPSKLLRLRSAIVSRLAIREH